VEHHPQQARGLPPRLRQLRLRRRRSLHRRRRRLLTDPGIVRNRLKIASTISNAQALLAVRAEFGTFDAYVWSLVPGAPIRKPPRAPIPASTPESDAMSKDLKKRGFRFVGTTICYAFMQATGMADDHEVGCFRYCRTK
jgi:DNA-3-methyladenine glycosylase I